MDIVHLLAGADARASLDAQLQLGEHFENASAADTHRALVWFAVAAAGGSQKARAQLAELETKSSPEVFALVAAAVDGEAEPRRELAMRLHDGTGVPADPAAALAWMRRAAENGDAWSQTAYALQLGALNDPLLSEERFDWLVRAAAQGDPRATMNVGLCRILGHGTVQDSVSGVVNLIDSSLAGYPDARDAVEQVVQLLNEEEWARVLRLVRWPRLLVEFGALVGGHLEGLRESRTHEPLSETAAWWQYDIQSVRSLLGPQGVGGNPFLDAVFGETVHVKGMAVKRIFREGVPYAQVTINVEDVLRENGRPVHWIPAHETLRAVTSTMAMLDAREWIRCDIVHSGQ